MNKKVLGASIATIAAVVLVSFSGYALHKHMQYSNVNNFPTNTTINNIDVSGSNIKETYALMKDKIGDQKVSLYENTSASKPKYVFRDAGLKYYDLNLKEIKGFLKKSRDKDNPQHTFTLKRTPKKYKNFIESIILDCSINQNRTKGTMAVLEKGANQFEVTKEIKANYIHLDKLISNIQNKGLTSNNDTNTYFLSDYYYKMPKAYLGYKKLNKLRNEYNNDIRNLYLKETSLTPQITLKKQDIFDMMTLTGYNLSINDKKLANWITTNVSKYDNVKQYNTTVKTPDKVKHTFNQGEHGLKIDTVKLSNTLAKTILFNRNNKINVAIKKIDNKKPISYVAINLKTLHEYVIKNGKTVVSTPIMSGKPGSNATPKGTFAIAFKQSPATLRGYNDDGSKYASPVKYWEPFNGGVGLHDSDWQPESVYGNKSLMSTYGSHGCINNPPSIMGKVYKNTFVGETVFVY